MDTFWKIIGYLSIPMVLVGVFVMLSSIKKEQRIGGRTLLLQAGFAFAVLILYQVILGADMSGPWPWVLLLGGAVAGIVVGRTTEVFKRDGVAYARRSFWFLVPWALTFGFAQLIALGAIDQSLFAGVSTLYASTGIALGATGVLAYRRLDLIGVEDTAGELAGAVFDPTRCPNCRAQLASGARFCRACGRRVLIADPEPTGAGFVATHRVPESGLQAWGAPDPAGNVVATLPAGTAVALKERRGDWARVLRDDGWDGWVDARRLEEKGA
jgi:hypothetical protein